MSGRVLLTLLSFRLAAQSNWQCENMQNFDFIVPDTCDLCEVEISNSNPYLLPTDTCLCRKMFIRKHGSVVSWELDTSGDLWLIGIGMLGNYILSLDLFLYLRPSTQFGTLTLFLIFIGILKNGMPKSELPPPHIIQQCVTPVLQIPGGGWGVYIPPIIWPHPPKIFKLRSEIFSF